MIPEFRVIPYFLRVMETPDTVYLTSLLEDKGKPRGPFFPFATGWASELVSHFKSGVRGSFVCVCVCSI